MQCPVRESGVKEIAGSRSVDNSNLVGGSIPEAAAIPSERAIYSERGANSARTIFPLELRERLEEILFSRGVDREFFRGHGEIDEGKKTLQSGRHVIQIGDNRDAGCARPRGGHARGGRIVPVDVQEPRRSDPASL